ncbi:FAD-binding domain-containing protein [Mesobacillus jeotgali]|uniref:FAD-binding domain-containing protein n=1 Tax=Mesobacillus jeotgali TaxID=129985 RepID=UPI0009A75E07|nr:FAD-binding domain-containing protein [Mesobacillus jeotgali]
MNIVLFNRDLRIFDHQPLGEAAKMGEILPLYILEPSEWEEDTHSIRHFQFVVESLEELSEQIENLGGKLFFSINKLEEVLEKLLEAYESINIFVHRNSFLLEKILEWSEHNQQRVFIYGPDFGSVTAKLFKQLFQEHVKEPLVEKPAKIYIPKETPSVLFTDIKKIKKFRVKGKRIRFGQQGGESRATETLDSFLEERFANYVGNQHKPLPSSFSSSRLSAYISWGNISVRTVFQKTTEALETCDSTEERHQLETFLSKLIARVKSSSMIPENNESVELSKIKNGWNEEWFERWLEGRTGFPIIDAAMRSLDKTGWLNFTLREMVTSFITNTLLMDGQKPGTALAQLYLDYEPALHSFYFRHISGLTAKVKIINPLRVGKQIDPEGAFIRRYISELENIPIEYIHEPWLYPGFYQLGYPTPMIDVVKANKSARQKFKSLTQETKPARKNTEGETEQLSFDL